MSDPTQTPRNWSDNESALIFMANFAMEEGYMGTSSSEVHKDFKKGEKGKKSRSRRGLRSLSVTLYGNDKVLTHASGAGCARRRWRGPGFILERRNGPGTRAKSVPHPCVVGRWPWGRSICHGAALPRPGRNR